MGFYSKYVLPRLIDVSMRNKETARLRAEWVPQAHGEVLKIGVGSDLNLPFYSSEVERVYGLDPSPELLQMASQEGNGFHQSRILSTIRGGAVATC